MEKYLEDQCAFSKAGKVISIRWLISYWCNYRCSYCNQDHKRHKERLSFDLQHPKASILRTVNNLMGRPTYPHAFDNYPPEAWLEAFQRLNDYKIALLITGGEPFLDRSNFRALLKGLVGMDHIDNIIIHTNGTWSPEDYLDEVNFSKIYLVVSFHPSQTTLERFKVRVKCLQDHNINISMVNFVISPDQIEVYEPIRQELGALGIKMNPSVFFPLKGHIRSEEEMALYRRYLNPFDIGYKTGLKSPLGKPCRFPTVGYELWPNGVIHVGCYPELRCNFLKHGFPPSQDEPPACRESICNCFDKYAFLLNSRRGKSMNLLLEYLEEGLYHGIEVS